MYYKYVYMYNNFLYIIFEYFIVLKHPIFLVFKYYDENIKNLINLLRLIVSCNRKLNSEFLDMVE